MRGRLRSTATGALVVGACLAGWALAAPRPPAHALANCDTTTAAVDASESQVLALVNEQRSAAGLGTLRPSPSLSRATAWKSEDRSTSWGAGLSHTDSLGRSPSTRAGQCGYPNWVGENIAYGFPTPMSVVEAWMGSAGHRANILNRSYVVAGVGYSEGAWTMDFGTSDDSGVAPGPAATDKPTATKTPRQATATPTAPPTVSPVPTAPSTAVPGPTAPWGDGVVMELRAGVNLVTFAAAPMPVDEAVSSLAGTVENVWSWEVESGRWEAWAPGDAPALTLFPGQAYFLRLRADATWTY